LSYVGLKWDLMKFIDIGLKPSKIEIFMDWA
jgi:hypothetical protein